MRIAPDASDTAILAEIGRRLARARLSRNITQEALGDRAGVGLATIQRLEKGRPVSATNLVRVMRALDLLGGLEQVFPRDELTPLEALELQGRRRRRARSGRADATAEEPWTWGDNAS